MKSICISYIINLVITKYIEKVHRTHKKKLDNSFQKKLQEDGLKTNVRSLFRTELQELYPMRNMKFCVMD